MLSIDNLLLDLNYLFCSILLQCRLKPFIQFTGFGFLLFFVLIYPLLNALGNEPGLLPGLPWPLCRFSNFFRLGLCLG